MRRVRATGGEDGLEQAYKRQCSGQEHTRQERTGAHIGLHRTCTPAAAEVAHLGNIVASVNRHVAGSRALPRALPCTCIDPQLKDDTCQCCGVTPTYPPLCPIHKPNLDRPQPPGAGSRVEQDLLSSLGPSDEPGSAACEALRLRHVARRYAAQAYSVGCDVQAAAEELRTPDTSTRRVHARDIPQRQRGLRAQRARDLAEQLHLGIGLSWTFQQLPPAGRLQVAQLAQRLFSRLPPCDARAWRYGVTHHRRAGGYGDISHREHTATWPRAAPRGAARQFEHSPRGQASNPRAHNWDRD